MDLSVRWGWDSVYDWLFVINLSWAQELCIYMFVWMAKFGAAYGVRTGIHVGVDVLINQLSERWRRKFVLFGLGAGALFTGLVGTFGATFVWHIAHTASTTPDLEMPAWIRLPGHPARLLPDVLPLPAGRLVLLLDRGAAGPRAGARWRGWTRRSSGTRPPAARSRSWWASRSLSPRTASTSSAQGSPPAERKGTPSPGAIRRRGQHS